MRIIDERGQEEPLPPLFQAWNLDTFPQTGDQQALRQCVEFVATWSGQTGLALLGGIGTGKTGLLVGIGKRLASRVYDEWGSEILLLLNGFGFGASYPEEPPRPLPPMIDEVYAASLLMIDDLACQHFASNESNLQALRRLFAYRTQRRLATFFTSDLPFESLCARLGQPASDQLFIDAHTKVVTVAGPSLRKPRSS